MFIRRSVRGISHNLITINQHHSLAIAWQHYFHCTAKHGDKRSCERSTVPHNVTGKPKTRFSEKSVNFYCTAWCHTPKDDMFVSIVLRTSDRLRNTGLRSQGKKRLCVLQMLAPAISWEGIRMSLRCTLLVWRLIEAKCALAQPLACPNTYLHSRRNTWWQLVLTLSVCGPTQSSSCFTEGTIKTNRKIVAVYYNDHANHKYTDDKKCSSCVFSRRYEYLPI